MQKNGHKLESENAPREDYYRCTGTGLLGTNMEWTLIRGVLEVGVRIPRSILKYGRLPERLIGARLKRDGPQRRGHRGSTPLPSSR